MQHQDSPHNCESVLKNFWKSSNDILHCRWKNLPRLQACHQLTRIPPLSQTLATHPLRPPFVGHMGEQHRLCDNELLDNRTGQALPVPALKLSLFRLTGRYREIPDETTPLVPRSPSVQAIQRPMGRSPSHQHGPAHQHPKLN